MYKFTAACILTALVGTAAFAGPGPILTFGFTDLAASFDGTSAYTLDPTALTDGDVTRTVPATGTAEYRADWTGGTADFDLSMTISNITATTADGAGSFTVTDADGDTITGDFTGVWMRGAFFNGHVNNVYLTSDDGTFDGPSGGSFSTAFSSPQPFSGLIIELAIGTWFDMAFSDANTKVDVQLIPVPAAVLLGALGLSTVAWVRRKVA
jgi:hypothetical protein